MHCPVEVYETWVYHFRKTVERSDNGTNLCSLKTEAEIMVASLIIFKFIEILNQIQADMKIKLRSKNIRKINGK